MKYCTSCGKALQDDTKFCISCGSKCVQNTSTTSVSAVNTTQPSRKRNTKRLARNIILITIVSFLTVALIVSSVLVIRYNSTEQKVLRALDAGEYDEAIQLVSDDPDVQGSVILRKNLIKRINAIKDDFTNGTIEYSTACMELDTIEKFDMSHLYYGNLLIETRTYIEELNNSRAHFAAAESFYAAGDWGNAITNYLHVIEEDKNYTIAQIHSMEAMDHYRDDLLVVASEYAENELYYEAIILLKKSLNILSNDTKIKEQISLYEIQYADQTKRDLLQSAASLAESGNYLKAFQLLADIVESPSADAEVVAIYTKYYNTYIEQVVDEANSFMDKEDYSNAISILSDSIRELGKNETLSIMLNEIIVEKEQATAVCFNGHFYKIYAGQATWDAAATFCASVGGHLATITSKEENVFLYNYIISQNISSAYFGYSDSEKEGNWNWVTGEISLFTNWASGEPSNEGGKEDYAQFYKKYTDGKWNDGSFTSSTSYFICEWE